MCKQCGKEFEAVRDTATYCSATCRSKARVSVQDNLSVPEVSVQKDDNLSVQSEKKVSVQNTPKTQSEQIDKNPDNTPGVCHGCGIDTHWDICEICGKCVQSGLTRKKLNLPEVERINFTDDKFIPNWKKNKMTHTEAIERAIYSIASLGCDCIVGNKIYESSRVMRVKI